MSRIEELEKELAAFHQRMKDELAKLRAEQSEHEKQPAEWPQVGDECWVGALVSDRVYSKTYADDSIDNFFKAIGDMHRTREEAEAYRAYRMNPRTVMRDRIQMWVDEYNGDWTPDWENDKQDKYCPSPLFSCGYAVATTSLAPFVVFDARGVAIMISKFGLANILWACGGPEPSEGR